MARSSRFSSPQPANLTAEQLRATIPKLERRLADLRALQPEKFADFSLEANKIAKRINATLADVFGHDSFEYNEYDISWASFVQLNMNFEYPQNEK